MENNTVSGGINWFPGHMAKTRRKIAEDLKLVDIVAEIVDARIPKSTSNPVLRDIIKEKPRIVLLNKSDMADAAATAQWVKAYAQRSLTAIPVECKTGKGLSAFYSSVRAILKEKLSAWEEKGMGGHPVRIMVVGIPNVGKSSFINRVILGSGAGKAEVRDKPGVTRLNRWFTASQKGFELLDTPGVLWPKFEDPEVGRRLAFTGAIKDEVLDIEELAVGLLELLSKLYPDALKERYKIACEPGTEQTGYGLLELVGRKRGMLVSGGETDTQRAAAAVLDEFRGGKLGRITLEWPEK